MPKEIGWSQESYLLYQIKLLLSKFGAGGGGTASFLSFPTFGAFPPTGAPNTIYLAEDTNNIYYWDGSSYVQIAAGGNQGDTGVQGPKGDTGTKGDTGSGLKGDTGSPGVKGDTGTIGLKGDTGVSIKGDTGTAGAKGDTGTAGLKGDTGTKGDTGVKGDTGTAGSKGDTGAQGVQGDTGIGIKGDTGVAGTKGDTGTSGLKGDTGVKGDTGAKGDTGVIGIQGDTGIQGVKGDTGTKGDTGAGTKGDTGASGAKGDTGATGAGGALAYYGSFYSLQDQTAANTTTAYAVIAELTDEANGVSMQTDGTNLTRLTFTNGGTYNIQFSLQFINPGNADANFNIWFRQNGIDIPDSNTQYTIQKSHAGGDGTTVPALNFINTFNAGDYIQVMWQTEDTNVSIQTLPAGTTPTTPVTPSVILTAQQIMYTIKGDSGVQGLKGDTGAKGDTGVGTAGQKGDTGTQGDTGVSGAKGDTGTQGVQGDTGIAGSKGDTGNQGVKGDTGSVGAKGDTGSQGDTGVAGTNGAKGDTGSSGLKGDTGSKGDTGIAGIQGDTGASGVKGDTGNQGLKGDTGASGGGSANISFNRQTSSYTLVIGDASKLVEMNVGSANNLTVPPASSVGYDTGATIYISQYGAGQTTIVAGSGVTLRSTNSWRKINAQYGIVGLTKVGADEWYLYGNLNA
jgi:hypothetical protein